MFEQVNQYIQSAIHYPTCSDSCAERTITTEYAPRLLAASILMFDALKRIRKQYEHSGYAYDTACDAILAVEEQMCMDNVPDSNHRRDGSLTIRDKATELRWGIEYIHDDDMHVAIAADEYIQKYGPEVAETLIRALDFINVIANRDICRNCEDQIRAREFLKRIGSDEG